MSFRESTENPIVYFAVTDMEAVPRRTVVTKAKCEQCHGSLMEHGSARRDPEYCVMCHNALTYYDRDDPPRSVNFKLMIHRIHTGEDLTRHYSIGSHEYNELRFPGDRRDCNTCHEGDSYELPSGGVLSTEVNNEFFSPLPPDTTACLGCHDTVDAAAHAFLNIAPFGEACGVCHGPNGDFAVARVHARLP
jgi:OmcA/MtrC family decaheme c-type cytochrome